MKGETKEQRLHRLYIDKKDYEDEISELEAKIDELIPRLNGINSVIKELEEQIASAEMEDEETSDTV